MKPVLDIHRPVSKSVILRAMQATDKTLGAAWRPLRQESDTEQQARSIIRHRLNAAAYSALGDGTVVNMSHGRAQAVAETEACMSRQHKRIFQACFVFAGVFVWVDALEKVGANWSVVCVRSSRSVKRHHLLDATLQCWALVGLGFTVCSVEIMHLNVDWDWEIERHPFKRQNVTSSVLDAVPTMSPRVESAFSALQSSQTSMAVPARTNPVPESTETKRIDTERPLHPIDELYRVKKKSLSTLATLGVAHIHEIPDDFPLPSIARRQRRAVLKRGLVIEDGLSHKLGQLPFPIGFIDFEAVTPAIPIWHGTKPFESIPVQVSIHRLDAAGRVTQAEWIASPGPDPRPALGQFVLQETTECGVLIAYNTDFEKACIQHLARFAEDGCALGLAQLSTRLFDMFPIVQHHVYHPAFKGRFNLKRVVSTLLPELDYDDLQIRNGDQARIELEALLIEPKADDSLDRIRVRAALLDYCCRDTMVLVRLYEKLLALTRDIHH